MLKYNFMNEDISDELREYRDKKSIENTQKIIDHFKDELTAAGAEISHVVLCGNKHRLLIKGDVSDDLKKRIMEYASRFYKWPLDP